MPKLVCGVGTNDKEDLVRVNKKIIKSYDCWRQMLVRCYNEKYQIKHTTYVGCSVCDEWLLFSNFKTWYDENYVEGFELDKDILVEGNKVYSPDTCRFVPNYLNSLLTDSRNARGDLPLGVSINTYNIKNIKYSYIRAHCSTGYGVRLSKTFKTILEAQAWYSITKKRVVKEQAIRAFLDNAIKTDIYLALVRREF